MRQTNKNYILAFRTFILLIGITSIFLPFQEFNQFKKPASPVKEHFIFEYNTRFIFYSVYLFLLMVRYYLIPRLNSSILIIGFFGFIILPIGFFGEGMLSDEHNIKIGGVLALLLYPLIIMEWLIQRRMNSK